MWQRIGTYLQSQQRTNLFQGLSDRFHVRSLFSHTSYRLWEIVPTMIPPTPILSLLLSPVPIRIGRCDRKNGQYPLMNKLKRRRPSVRGSSLVKVAIKKDDEWQVLRFDQATLEKRYCKQPHITRERFQTLKRPASYFPRDARGTVRNF